MSADAEAVAAAIANNPDTAYARHMLVGDLEPEDLDYDDWMAALRWSDGQVCIAIEAWWVDHFESIKPEETRLYYRLTEDGLIERAPPDEYGRATMTHMHFAPTLQHHLDRAQLVLVEESEFSEAAEGGSR